VRRILGATALTVVLALTACGSGGDTDEGGAGDTPDDRGVPSIVFTGDSVMRELSAGIIEALGRQAEATYVGMPVVGGNADAVAEWEQRMADDPPDLVVVQVGVWEVKAAPHVAYGLVGYGDSLDGFLDVVTPHADVLWLGHPALQDPAADEVLDQLVGEWEALPEVHPEVAYLDAGSAVEGDGGAFQTLWPLADGGQALVRQIDGVHLCADGVVLEGRAVLAVLAERYGFRVTDEWESGPWREDPAVFEDPEYCPAGLGDPLLG